MTAVLETPTSNPHGLVRGVAVLHLPECPHVAKWDDLAAPTPDELATWEVCSWSQAEIDGVGRTYYDTLDQAMEALGSAVDDRRQIRAAMATVDYDTIWIPYSESYIALGKNGYAVAWVHRTFFHAEGRDVLLPGFVHRGHDGGTEENVRHGKICLTHFVEMSLTGVCDQCD